MEPKSHDEEEFVAELLEEYIQARRRGEAPTAEKYLERCPGQSVERLKTAIEGIEFALHGYGSDLVNESVIQRTFEQVQEIQSKRAKKEND